ncbi:MAG: RNA 2'-phosphotransferase [Armatimonadetes bacterium]|nr:RNA 2'-phosphotransferase [Armatimonadota bacterium]
MAGLRAGTRSDTVRRARLSRLLALVLRHRPEKVGLTLDVGGFAPLEAVTQGLASQPGWESITTADLIAVAEADRRRYEVRDGRIRARYGHTVSVEEPGEPATPPEWLYYGTSRAAISELQTAGLRPGARQYVHLSTTPGEAREVGRRHTNDPVVVVVFARRAAEAGVTFRRAGPALYLTEGVPPESLLIPEETPAAQSSEATA